MTTNHFSRLDPALVRPGRVDVKELLELARPAFALYMRCPDGSFTPFHLQVLTLGPDGVRHVGAFFGAEVFATFGLPETLPADSVPG